MYDHSTGQEKNLRFGHDMRILSIPLLLSIRVISATNALGRSNGFRDFRDVRPAYRYEDGAYHGSHHEKNKQFGYANQANFEPLDDYYDDDIDERENIDLRGPLQGGRTNGFKKFPILGRSQPRAFEPISSHSPRAYSDWSSGSSGSRGSVKEYSKRTLEKEKDRARKEAVEQTTKLLMELLKKRSSSSRSSRNDLLSGRSRSSPSSADRKTIITKEGSAVKPIVVEFRLTKSPATSSSHQPVVTGETPVTQQGGMMQLACYPFCVWPAGAQLPGPVVQNAVAPGMLHVIPSHVHPAASPHVAAAPAHAHAAPIALDGYAD